MFNWEEFWNVYNYFDLRHLWDLISLDLLFLLCVELGRKYVELSDLKIVDD